MKPRFVLFFLAAGLLSSCNYQWGEEESTPGMESLRVPDGFEFSTTRTFQKSILLTQSGQASGNLLFDVYGSGEDRPFMGRFRSSESGSSFSFDFPISDSSPVIVPVETSVFEQTSTFVAKSAGFATTMSTPVPITKNRISGNLYSLGSWSSVGVPTQLWLPSDIVAQSLLNDINASLPETRPVPSFNPEYLKPINMNTFLNEAADVWVTFVHEGAGWTNSLGYFVFDPAKPPTSPAQIDSLVVIFPNVSFNGSGGGLVSGNKMYLGRFPANTGIGWFLIPQGWASATRTVAMQNQVKYSFREFNTYTTEQHRQHLVLLKDEARELLLLGFEDTTRPGGDNDFNDAVFYVSANPFTAVVTDIYDEIKVSKDSDGDGVLDHLDDYPTDPARAFNSYWPSATGNATFLFEDMWPAKGDYDFNDLVTDIRYQFVKNAADRVVDIQIKGTLHTVGGSFRNGLAATFELPSGSVQSVTGQNLRGKVFERLASGEEAGQSKMVIPLFDDSRQLLAPPAGFHLTNVLFDQPKQASVPFTVTVTLKTPVTQASLGSAPFDVFLVANQERGREVHLAGKKPTDKADKTLFGSEDDSSNLTTNRSYVSKTGLPWALQVATRIPHPIENRDFSLAYANFSKWVESNGTRSADWFQDKPGYRNAPFLFLK